MSLIKCTECSKEVSDKATSCPNCGNPIRAMVIEQTNKKWKKKQVTGLILVIIGGIMLITSFGLFQEFNSVQFLFGLIIFFVGFGTLIAAGIGAWWNHG